MQMKKYVVYFMMFLISFSAFSEMDESIKITDIQIVNNKEIPVEVILNDMESKIGEEYSTTQMLNDYLKLKKKAYIEDLSMYPQLYDAGVRLVIELKESENAKDLLREQGILPLSEQETVDKSLIIKSVEIYGNMTLSTEDILAKIPAKVGSYFSKSAILEGQRKILEMGYFRDVSPEVLKYEDGIYVKYNVLENQVINGIKITGNTLFTEEELLRVMETKSGEIYNINTLREDKDRILNKYHEAGYTLANFSNLRLTPDMDLEITVTEGVIKEIVYKKMIKKESGERRSPEKSSLKTENFVIDREIVLKEGEVFDRNKLQKSIRNLFRIGLFKNIKYEFKSIPDDPNSKILVMLFDENRTGSINGAISYGSAVGLVGTLSLQDTNFKGKGQTVKLSYEATSEDRIMYELSFSDPWIKDTDRVSWGWGIYRTEYTDSDSILANEIKKVGFKASVGKGLTENVRVKLGSKFEFVQEYNVDDELNDEYEVVSVYPSIIYDTRDSIFNPTEGEYARYTIELGKVLDGSDFYDTELELRKYHRGLFDNNVMAYRVVGGIATDSIKDSQKFRVGGANSLRGYDYGEYRGVEELYGNIENRTKLNDMTQFVLFYDFGRAWDSDGEKPEYNEDFPNDIKQSYGLGFRLNTPLGPLRFDYGWPIGDSDKTGGKFYFNIGQTF